MKRSFIATCFVIIAGIVLALSTRLSFAKQLGASALAATVPQASLRNATISFHTNDDDKDNDTAVSLRLICGNQEVASVDRITGTRFPDQGDNGPFAFNVHGNPSQAVMNAGTLKVHISPNGNDTWKFNATLTLEFTDGTRRSYSWNGLRLDQDNSDVDLNFR